MRIRMNDQRERCLDRLQEVTGENTKAKASDVAIQHYLADLRTKREFVDELPPEVLEELSTTWLPISTTISVGREDGK